MPDQNNIDAMMALAQLKMKQEMPDVGDTSVSPMGWIGQHLAGRANAITNPFTGSIYYNPNQMQSEGMDQNGVDNVLAHELTHTRQIQDRPWYERLTAPLQGLTRATRSYDEYAHSPEEAEAFQTENDRTLNQHLPSPGDIQLPTPPKRKGPNGYY